MDPTKEEEQTQLDVRARRANGAREDSCLAMELDGSVKKGRENVKVAGGA